MKTDAITAKNITNVILKKINPKTTEKVGEIEFKNGEKALATAQDAMASQGKAMVKKTYVKPEVKFEELDKNGLEVASGPRGTTDIVDDGTNYSGSTTVNDDIFPSSSNGFFGE